MDLPFIERLIDLMGRAPIQELDLAKDGWRIRLTKAAPKPGDHRPEAEPSPPFGTPAVRAADPATPVAEKPQLVVAGLVGTFYRASGPGNPPFVSVGDAVEEGQTLGILEAMKTLIKVEADCAGTVTEILADDGASVQTGDPLFAIVPAIRP